MSSFAEPDERFGVVLERYVQEEIPKRFSTKHAYLSYINNHIRPKWGEFPLTQVKPLAVRDWPQNNPGQEGQASFGQQKREVTSKGSCIRIFDCAMLWEYLLPDRNPMSLVRIEGSSKRRKKPRVLTPEEFVQAPHHGESGTVSHDGDPRPLYRREMLGVGPP